MNLQYYQNEMVMMMTSWLLLKKIKNDNFLTLFNGYNLKLQFTKQNQLFRFLDMTIIQTEKTKCIYIIKKKWYTEASWSGRYIQFNSQQPNTHKRSIISNLVYLLLHLQVLGVLPVTVPIFARTPRALFPEH